MLGSALQKEQGVARRLRELPGGSPLLDQERHLPGAGGGERETWKTTFKVCRGFWTQCDSVTISRDLKFDLQFRSTLFCQPTPLKNTV